jgi:ArpU family phage transcriptional regulator
MEEYKNTLYKAFRKYERMKKIFENPINQKLTQSFQSVVVGGGIKENTFEKMIINKADAEFYIKVLNKAIEQLENSEERPYQDIITYRYVMQPHYSAVRISIMIGFSCETYFRRLKEAQQQLAEVISLWGLVVE